MLRTAPESYRKAKSQVVEHGQNSAIHDERISTGTELRRASDPGGPESTITTRFSGIAFRASATHECMRNKSIELTLAPAYSYPRHWVRVLNAVSLQHRSTLGTVMYEGVCWQVLKSVMTSNAKLQ